MIISSPRIFGNFGAVCLAVPLFILLKPIATDYRHHTLGTRDQHGRVDPFLKVVLHPAQICMHVLVEPLLQLASLLIQRARLSSGARRVAAGWTLDIYAE